MKVIRFTTAWSALAVLGFALPMRANLVNGIKAIVHDSVITFEDIAALTEQTSDVLRRDYRDQPDVLQKKLKEADTENLDKSVSQQLILHEFKTAGYNIPESIIDEEVQDRIRSRFGDQATLTKTLQAEGITREKFRQRLKEQFIVAALKQKNISSEIIVSPHRVEAYYLAHKDEYKLEDEVKLRMIVLKQGAAASSEGSASSAQKMAEEIQGKLKNGVSFVEMATVYSEGSQRSKGGDMGWWERSRLNKGLADMAFSLSPGQASGVMSRSAGDNYWICSYEDGHPKTGRHYVVDPVTKKESLVEEKKFENGSLPSDVPPPEEFYLMLVEDKRQAHVKSLGEVREKIEADMVREERVRLEKQWIERLRKKTFVRYF